MNIKHIISAIAASGTLLAGLSGCEGEYQPDYERVYIGEASSSRYVKMQVEGATETKLTIKLVKPQKSPVTVTLGLDPTLLDEYNAQNGANYLALPDEYIKMEKTAVIAANESSIEIPILIESYDTPNDEQYALPLAITSVEGPVTASVSSSNLTYLLDKPLIQWVPQMTWRCMPKSDPDKQWKVQTKDWSIECLNWKDNYGINNQAIISMVATKEIYIRFGDTSIPYNSLQVKYGGSQVNNPTLFTTSRWDHLAFIYSQAAKELSIYVNGVKTGKLDIDTETIELNGISIHSSGQSYNRGNSRMAQLRIWSRALNESELNANMHAAVSPNAEGLVAYYKMNEGEGDTYKDCTSNGRDIICLYAPQWIENQRFDGK